MESPRRRSDRHDTINKASNRGTRVSGASREQGTTEVSEAQDTTEASGEQETAGMNPADPEWQRWIWEEEHPDDPEWRNQRAQAILGGYSLQATTAQDLEFQQLMEQNFLEEEKIELQEQETREQLNQELLRMAERTEQNDNIEPQEGESGYINSLAEYYQRKARLRGVDPATGQSMQPAIQQTGNSCFPILIQAYLTAMGRDTSALADFLTRFPNSDTSNRDVWDKTSTRSLIARESNRAAKKYMERTTRTIPTSQLDNYWASDIVGSARSLLDLYKQNEFEEVRDELAKIRMGSDVTDEDVSQALTEADHDWDRYQLKKVLGGQLADSAFSKTGKKSKEQKKLLEQINTRRDQFRNRASNDDVVSSGEGLLQLISRRKGQDENISTRRINIKEENSPKEQATEFITALKQTGTPAALMVDRLSELCPLFGDGYTFLDEWHATLIYGMKKRDGKVYIGIREGNQTDGNVAEVEAESFFAAYSKEIRKAYGKMTEGEDNGQKSKPTVATLTNIRLGQKDIDRLSKPLPKRE